MVDGVFFDEEQVSEHKIWLDPRKLVDTFNNYKRLVVMGHNYVGELALAGAIIEMYRLGVYLNSQSNRFVFIPILVVDVA